MQRILLALATAALCGFAAAPAVADEPYRVRIAYGDLNLSTQAGADHMSARIRRAARDTCEMGGATLSVRIAQRACIDDFTRRAFAELDSAMPQRAYARSERTAETVVASR